MNFNYQRIIKWGKLITVTGISQGLIQLLNFLSGLIIIRVLPPAQYGMYVIANAMVGTILVLSDGGVQIGVMAQASKFVNSDRRLAQVVSSGLYLRKRFAIGSLFFSVPVLFFLLFRNGSSLLSSLAIIVSIIPGISAALSGSILEVVPKLQMKVKALQRIQLSVGFFRLLLSTVSIVLLPWAFIAIIASGIPQLWGNRKLKNLSSSESNLTNAIDKSFVNHILSIVKRVLPGSIYFCLSGQLSIWLASFFGSNTSVAQIGALGRISMLLSIVSISFNILVIPKFAVLEFKKSVIVKAFVKSQTALSIMGFMGIALTHIFAKEILLILGKNYFGLEQELLLTVVNGVLTLLAGCLFSLLSSRGWTINPLISIPLNLSVTILAMITIDISDIKGVLQSSMLVMGVEVLMYLGFAVYKLRNIDALPHVIKRPEIGNSDSANL